MVKVQEHIEKMQEIQKHINNSRGKQKLQYIKCLHKLKKELKMCKKNMSQG